MSPLLSRTTVGGWRTVVEKLTTDWQATKEARFRVRDWEPYGAQMLQLMGLGDLVGAEAGAGRNLARR